MQFETLKRGKFLSRKWVLGEISSIVLVLVVILSVSSYAKYQNIKTIHIAKGTVNYKMPDVELIAIY